MDHRQYVKETAQLMIADSVRRKEELLIRLRDRFTNLLPYQRNEGRALKTLVALTSAGNETTIQNKEIIVLNHNEQNYLFSMCEKVTIQASELLYVYEMDSYGKYHNTLQDDGSYLVFQEDHNIKILDQLIFSLPLFPAMKELTARLYLHEGTKDSVLKEMIDHQKISAELQQGENVLPLSLHYNEGICLQGMLADDEQAYELVLSFHEQYPPFEIHKPYLLFEQTQFNIDLLYVNETKVVEPAMVFPSPFIEDTCFYIGLPDLYLDEQTQLSLSFLLAMDIVEKNITHEKVHYKWIMRSWPISAEVYDVVVHDIVFEYYNGEKWIIIDALLSFTHVFKEKKNGYLSLSIPPLLNWQPCEVNDCMSRFIRIRMVRSENNYQNCVRYHIPVIRDLQIHINERMVPMTTIVRNRFKKEDISEAGKHSYLMEVKEQKHSIFLGFTKGVPQSLYFQILNGNGNQIKASIYHHHFTSTAISDGTNAFSKSGRILLLDESKSTPVILFDTNEEIHWLRLEFDRIGQQSNLKIAFNVGEAMELYSKSLTFTLDEINKRFCIPFTDIKEMYVYIKEEDYVLWKTTHSVLDLQANQRIVHFDESQSLLIFHSHIFQYFHIAEEKDNVQILFEISTRLKELPMNVSGQVYQANERIRSLSTICEAYGFIEREDDIQMIEHTAQLCSTFHQIITREDLRKWLFTNYPTIQDCRLYEQDHEMHLILHFQKQELDQQLLDEIKMELMHIPYLKEKGLEVSFPLYVEVSFEVIGHIKSNDTRDIKEMVTTLLNSKLICNIGNYPQKHDCEQSVAKLLEGYAWCLDVFEIYVSYQINHVQYTKKIEDATYFEKAMIQKGVHRIKITRSSYD